jgi:hypothetical protein
MQRFACSAIVLLVLTVLTSLSDSQALSLDRTKFKGDLRLRYQYDKKKVDGDVGSDSRHRERIRFRFGFQTDVSDRLRIGMRLASGSEDPRSTNQSFGDLFTTKGIHLDQAYFAWQPFGGLTVKGGKFGKALYLLDDLLWDSDITFEGQAARIEAPGPGNTSLFVNGGLFLLDELKSEGTDPHMFAIQPGVRAEFADGLEAGVFLAYYGFTHINSAVFEHAAGTNTRETEEGALSEGNLRYDYDSVNPTIGITRTWGSEGGAGYFARLVGDMVYNPDSEDTGYLVGFAAGHSTVKETGSWQFHYNWRRLEADAFLDIFPDSDFYGGATGVSGHEFILNCGIGGDFILGFDYYRADKIEGAEDARDLLQVDLVAKF